MFDSFRANPYIRILGMNENGKKLLAKISKENHDLEVITSVKKFLDNSSNNILKNMIRKDILGSDIYGKPNLDYTNKIVYP